MGGAAGPAPPEHSPLWRPEAKVFGTYLTPYLQSLGQAPDAGGEQAVGVVVEEALPGVGSDAAQELHAL
jgi:hypothetical protein